MKTVEVDGNIFVAQRIVAVGKLYEGFGEFQVYVDSGVEGLTFSIRSESKSQLEQWHDKIRIAMDAT